MKAKKVFAEQMMEDLGEMKLTKKELIDNARVMAHESEEFANMVFEVGAKEIFKEFKKLYRKEKKRKVEKYSNGDHFEPLTDIEEAISFITEVMRNAQYSEREVQRFVYGFYEQFNVPEDRRFLLKHVGSVSKYIEDDDCGFWIIEGDDERAYDAYASSVRGGRDLQAGEVVSFIPDGTTAKYIENSQHCDQEEDDEEPLKYSPASIDDFWDLRDMILYLTAPASPGGIGKGTVFIYKETPEGGKMRNFFVKRDGSMCLSEIY